MARLGRVVLRLAFLDIIFVNRVRRVVVACPASICSSWIRESVARGALAALLRAALSSSGAW